MKHKIVVVGGTFDRDGGRESYYVQQIAGMLGAELINGGYIANLYEFRPKGYDIVIWMPNVDNSEDKILPRLKVMNPKMILVCSKRCIENEYTHHEISTRALNVKANLSIVLYKAKTGGFNLSLLDPLGNLFCEGVRLERFIVILHDRLNFLMDVKRTGSSRVPAFSGSEEKVTDEFLNIVRCFGHRFSDLIEGQNPLRFLGNASTRCCHGFPSMRGNDTVLVSKRNVDKASMTVDDFVAVKMDDDIVEYVGQNKPSVDAPVQLKLYDMYPNINYMVHGHCYLYEAPYTAEKHPCGDMNEVYEIARLVPDFSSNFFIINHWGHGCLIAANDINDLSDVKLMPRVVPDTGSTV